jgi:hypothetical protein
MLQYRISSYFIKWQVYIVYCGLMKNSFPKNLKTNKSNVKGDRRNAHPTNLVMKHPIHNIAVIRIDIEFLEVLI